MKTAKKTQWRISTERGSMGTCNTLNEAQKAYDLWRSRSKWVAVDVITTERIIDSRKDPAIPEELPALTE